MHTPRRVAGFLGEWLLWGVANLICMALPLGALYVVGSQLLGWSPWTMSLYLSLGAALTATWGSWATLVFTRSRALRGLQQLVTTTPGLLMLVGAVALFWAWPARWLVAATLLVAGVGNLALSLLLTGGLFTRNQAPSRLQYLLGAVAFPVATTGVSGLVATLWYMFMHRGAPAGFKELFSVATLMISIMAFALISTVIPAGMSRLARHASALWVMRQRG